MTENIQMEMRTETLLVLDSCAVDVISAHAARREILSAARAPEAAAKSRYSVIDGTAVIAISGPLVNWGDVDLSEYGYTSYGWLVQSFERAKADTEVKAVALQVNSPGGVVSGIESAAGSLASLSALKPTIAHVEGMAASAAYWIASQARSITMTELSQVGSIGVFTAHYDYSKLLDRVGIGVTLISSGRHKVEGNPFGPLPDGVKSDMQAEVDDLRLAFARAVASGRKSLSAEAAMATEARMYRGMVSTTGKSEAVEFSLADRVGTFASVLSDLSQTPRGARSGRAGSLKNGGIMSENESAPAAEAGFTKADLDAARAEGVATGRADANARISAIASDAAIAGNGARLSAAIDLAIKSPDMAANDVASFVGKVVPEQTVTRRENPANALGDAPGSVASTPKSRLAEQVQATIRAQSA